MVLNASISILEQYHFSFGEHRSACFFIQRILYLCHSPHMSKIEKQQQFGDVFHRYKFMHKVSYLCIRILYIKQTFYVASSVKKYLSNYSLNVIIGQHICHHSTEYHSICLFGLHSFWSNWLIVKHYTIESATVSYSLLLQM